jgi:antitoxin FitA
MRLSGLPSAESVVAFALAGMTPYAVVAAFDSTGVAMATLTVRNLDDDIVRRLRVRAAEHGRSAEAEHREILRLVLTGDESRQSEQRQRVAERLAEFRRRTGGRGSSSAAQLLDEVRAERARTLAGSEKAD